MGIVTIIFILLAIISTSRSQDKDGSERGIYFSKKIYVPTPIPKFGEKRDKLPAPILEDNPEYIELYWKAWELAFQHFKRPLPGSPFVSNYIDEAFAPQIFQWDTIFMIQFARYAHYIFPVIQSLDNFYSRQHINGYICREIFEADGNDFYYEGVQNTVNPPLFAWAEVESFKITGDKSRLDMVYPVLVKYTEWLETGRKALNSQHGLYWNTGLGSGMDNSPRGGTGWVDMSAQMAIVYNSLAIIAEEIDRKNDAQKFRLKAQEIRDRINQYMWNEQDGLYYDIDDDGHQIKWKTVACFWPMLAGISTPHQVEKMMANLRDSKSFYRINVFPSLAADQPGYKPDGQYWLGSVWAPTNVVIIKGLDHYESVSNTTEFAIAATEKYLNNIYCVYKKTGTIWENYAPEAAMRGSWSRPDFIGWSGCGPIQLLIENILGFRPDGVNNKLTWYLHRIDYHGIERLYFGKVTTSLICQRRNDLYSPITINVQSNQPYELIIDKLGEKKVFAIKTGKQNLKW